jgi:GTP-binding protein LepA
MFSALDFEHFDEGRFWQDFEWFKMNYAWAGLSSYRDEFEREAFIDNLLAALTPVPLPLGEECKGEGNLTLIITLRADFYAHLAQYPELRDALEKLRLNDSAFSFEPENSAALGFGFRCGFLGLLHLEIVQERLEREFEIDLITTAPGVRYQVRLLDGRVLEVNNPQKFPDPATIKQVEEPIIDATVITREESLGEILKLLEDKRGIQKKFEYIGTGRVLLLYELPLNEIVLDFYDRLKSASRGYASLDYHLAGYRTSSMVKLDVLVAGEPVDALSMIIHKEGAYERGKGLIERLRKLIPRQMFEVALQAAIGNKVIARETISAMRKNVIAKCYGGDISRKRKLLEKQKEGKRRMKRVGRVEIPQEAFLAVLKVTGESE